jgi:hypothetical protein
VRDHMVEHDCFADRHSWGGADPLQGAFPHVVTP